MLFGDEQPPLSGGRPSDWLRTLWRCEPHGLTTAKTAARSPLDLVSAKGLLSAKNWRGGVVGKTETGFR